MSTGTIVFLVMFALVFICRFPVAYGMICTGIMYFLVTGGNLTNIATSVCNTYWTGYVIMAVPLFVFAANVMNTGKITEMIFRFTDGLVGRFRGGMAHVNILASLIFSGMTGSALADASGLGVMEIEEMRKQGYDDGFSCAVTAASATIGPVFPPSNPMLIYASLTSVSVGKLFMGGMVPGVLLALFLCVYVMIISQKRKYPYGAHYTLVTFLTYTLRAIPALLTPVILLGGIYTGVVTPTEAGALAGAYALVVSLLVYRMLNWETLKKIILDTVRTTGTVSLTIGCASVILYVATKERIPQMFGTLILNFTNNKYVFLLICNIMFLFLGMLFDSTTISLVFIPMLLPIVNSFGIDLVHFGVIFVVNMMIGMLTPPYGPLLFATSAVSGVNLKEIIKETWPMMCVMLALLLVLTYFPGIITYLPNYFMG